MTILMSLTLANVFFAGWHLAFTIVNVRIARENRQMMRELEARFPSPRREIKKDTDEV